MLVTHDVAEAVALADRVLVMAEGRLVLRLPLPRSHGSGSPAFETRLQRVLLELSVHFCPRQPDIDGSE